MRVGIQFFPDVGPDVKSARDYWREALHLVALVDPYGYHHVRTVEHYFLPYGGYSPNPVVFLAAAAQVTKHARLITGAVLPAFNHPLKVAGELAMLDALSDGRLDCGFARAFSGTIITGHDARRTSSADTDPIAAERHAPRPRDPTTMSSAPRSSASSASTVAGSPRLTSRSTTRITSGAREANAA